MISLPTLQWPWKHNLNFVSNRKKEGIYDRKVVEMNLTFLDLWMTFHHISPLREPATKYF